MKVYAVMDYDYSDTDLVGIFSSEEKAKEFVARANTLYEIREKELDELLDQDFLSRAKIRFECYKFLINIDDRKGEIEKDGICWMETRKTFTSRHSYLSSHVVCYVPMSKGDAAAQKIAAEKYQEYLRLGSLGLRHKEIIERMNDEA